MARAARRVFATVDRLVGNHEDSTRPAEHGDPWCRRGRPRSLRIASVRLAGHYIHDESPLREYLAAGNALLVTTIATG